MIKVYNSQNRLVQLGKELGKGGEGTVLDLLNHQGLVAKIYHKAIGKEKAEKILSMTHLQNERLLRLSTWPVDTLHNTPNGPIIGFLMPKTSGFKEIHMLYGTKSRLSEFSNVGWPFLVHAAANLARAFNVVHEYGHVIGDVNHANIIVSNQATVMLIDCDSFQIKANSRDYLCDVGVSTHQPPELQGISLRNKLRTQNHDNFGLAVIIFQLLFLGRHPFSGMHLDSGDMPIERAIKEFRFAYSKSATSNKMRQPPGTLPLNAVPEQVGSLFEKAFSPEGVHNGRPSAQEWITTLDNLSKKQLRQCTRNPGHNFFSKLLSCPWCSIEAQTGIILFDVGISIRQNIAIFNLSAIWTQINNVSSPGPAPILPEPASLKISPTENAIKLGKARRFRIKISISIVIACLIVIKFAPVDETIAFWSILTSIFFASVYYKSGPDKERKEIERQYFEALNKWDANKKRWDKEAGDAAFVKQKRHLEQIRMEYLDLHTTRQFRIKQLESDKEKYQLKKYLDNYRIAKAAINGIGPSRKATLLSYGIEAAKDVTYNNIIRIPGFGPTYTKRMVEWRKNIEKKFVYNPKTSIDPKDVAVIEKEISIKKASLEKTLLNGAQTLKQLAQQIANKRQTLKSEIEVSLNILAQLEADLKVL